MGTDFEDEDERNDFDREEGDAGEDEENAVKVVT